MHESLLSAALPTAPQPLPRVYINLAAIFATVNYVRTCAWQKSFTVLIPGRPTTSTTAGPRDLLNGVSLRIGMPPTHTFVSNLSLHKPSKVRASLSQSERKSFWMMPKFGNFIRPWSERTPGRTTWSTDQSQRGSQRGTPTVYVFVFYIMRVI